MGSSILAAIGWMRNSKAEPTKVASEKKMRCARTKDRISEILSREAVRFQLLAKEGKEVEQDGLLLFGKRQPAS